MEKYFKNISNNIFKKQKIYNNISIRHRYNRFSQRLPVFELSPHIHTPKIKLTFFYIVDIYIYI